MDGGSNDQIPGGNKDDLERSLFVDESVVREEEFSSERFPSSSSRTINRGWSIEFVAVNSDLK